MSGNKVLQFEGDIRVWTLDTTTGIKTAVNPDVDDEKGNIPVEASASVFSYAAGTVRQVVSKRRDRFNQTIFSDEDPGESSLSLTLVAVPGAFVASMFYGEAASTSLTTATVTNEAVTITALDTAYHLAHRYLKDTPTITVKDVTNATTYIEGTDYTLNKRTGEIVALTGGGISAAAVVHVTYAYYSYELLTIRGGVKPTQTCYITGDMLNRPDKSDMSMEIYQATLSTNGDIDLFSATPLTLTLKGVLVTPEGKTEPYVVKQFTKS